MAHCGSVAGMKEEWSCVRGWEEAGAEWDRRESKKLHRESCTIGTVFFLKKKNKTKPKKTKKSQNRRHWL